MTAVQDVFSTLVGVACDHFMTGLDVGKVLYRSNGMIRARPRLGHGRTLKIYDSKSNPFLSPHPRHKHPLRGWAGSRSLGFG